MEELDSRGNDRSGQADIETEELIEKVAHELGGNARADVVFGKPVERDDVTVIPVAVASLGLGDGRGLGKGSQEGAGIGAGMRVSPVGYIEAGQGRVRFRRILPTWAFVSIALGIGAFAGLLLFGGRRES
ncbi:MAG: hypothetical protein GY769_25905 [bacterium]|nr:hypothetical protein [bacterium]